MRKTDLLLPLAPVYSAAVRLRSAAYRRGLFEQTRLEAPVVSVGNLSMGGTGKTPTVIALVRDLVQRGRRPAVLTRGYGRDTDESLVLIGPDPRESAARAGDEPLEIAAALPGVPVVVDADRVRGGGRAIGLGADVLVLDDGFQHLRLARDLDLVLLDAGDPWAGGRLPPRGRLREPLTALRRATAVLVTKIEDGAVVPPRLAEKIEALAPGVPVFGARLEATRVRTPDGVQGVGILAGRRVFAVAALGRPAAFRALLERLGAEVVGHEWFRDHHFYTAEEVDRIAAAARSHEAVVVTTAKDAVKLPAECGAWVADVGMTPLEGSWDRLWLPYREMTR